MLAKETLRFGVVDRNGKLIRKFNSNAAANEFRDKMAAQYPKHTFSSVTSTERINGSSTFKKDGTLYKGERKKKNQI